MKKKELTEKEQIVQDDVSLQRTVTMPYMLWKICRKYNISVSQATREGALMLLHMSDGFNSSDDNVENAYKDASSKYKEKVRVFANTINKITTGKEFES